MTSETQQVAYLLMRAWKPDDSVDREQVLAAAHAVEADDGGEVYSQVERLIGDATRKSAKEWVRILAAPPSIGKGGKA